MLEEICGPLRASPGNPVAVSAAALATAVKLQSWAAHQIAPPGPPAPTAEVLAAVVEALWQSLAGDDAPAADAPASGCAGPSSAGQRP